MNPKQSHMLSPMHCYAMLGHPLPWPLLISSLPPLTAPFFDPFLDGLSTLFLDHPFLDCHFPWPSLSFPWPPYSLTTLSFLEMSRRSLFLLPPFETHFLKLFETLYPLLEDSSRPFRTRNLFHFNTLHRIWLHTHNGLSSLPCSSHLKTHELRTSSAWKKCPQSLLSDKTGTKFIFINIIHMFNCLWLYVSQIQLLTHLAIAAKSLLPTSCCQVNAADLLHHIIMYFLKGNNWMLSVGALGVESTKVQLCPFHSHLPTR